MIYHCEAGDLAADPIGHVPQSILERLDRRASFHLGCRRFDLGADAAVHRTCPRSQPAT